MKNSAKGWSMVGLVDLVATTTFECRQCNWSTTMVTPATHQPSSLKNLCPYHQSAAPKIHIVTRGECLKCGWFVRTTSAQNVGSVKQEFYLHFREEHPETFIHVKHIAQYDNAIAELLSIEGSP